MRVRERGEGEERRDIKEGKEREIGRERACGRLSCSLLHYKTKKRVLSSTAIRQKERKRKSE